VQAKVLKGTQESALESIPQPQFNRDAAIEPRKYASTVGPFWRGSQAEQDPRAQVAQEPLVGGGSGAMELVHYHDVESVGPNVIELGLAQGLNRREHVSPLVGPVAVDEELAE
jgi:hypothetical protein